MNPVSAFCALHERGSFVIPNPWDVGSARFLHSLGFKALATTSAGFAFSRGLPDTVTSLSRDEVLTHVREIAGATSLPVNTDFQSGYARDLEELAANVTLCVQAGAAGLSIEDTDENGLIPRSEAIERIRAARQAINRTGVPVVLTARCEAWLVSVRNPLPTALDRLAAFAGAGADCLFAPRVPDATAIREIVKEVAPKPVNVLVAAPIPGLTVNALAELGVRRISVGSALARVAWSAFMKAARDIARTGSFDSFSTAASIQELNSLFSR
jgi:2-methylisocitrate lyase-like PEP mutase family enzyme